MMHSHTHAPSGGIPPSHSFKHTRRPLKAGELLPAIPTLIEQIVAACKTSRTLSLAVAEEDPDGTWLEEEE
jgi:hypothetical protein